MVNSVNTGVNKLLLLSALLLMSFGVFVVYSSTSGRTLEYGFDELHYVKSHCSKLAIALLFMFVGAKIDYSVWKKFARHIFWIGIILTFGTLVFGTLTNGARRWLQIPMLGPFQPSEILKLGVIFLLSTKLSDAGSDIKDFQIGIIRPAVPFVIALALLALQPNLSMMVVATGSFLAMEVVAEANLKHMLKFFVSLGVVGLCLALLREHSRSRIMAFLFGGDGNFEKSSHQAKHALEALANGGFTGEGFGQSTQKFGYLPEASKDVVYSVIGEECGFLGTFGVLFVFGLLFYQGFEIAKKATSRFGKFLAVGLTVSLFMNVLVHVCVCLKLFPTTGQPLPFMSYGGTNAIFTAFLIGILLNISKPGTGKKIEEPCMGASEASRYQTFKSF